MNKAIIIRNVISILVIILVVKYVYFGDYFDQILITNPEVAVKEEKNGLLANEIDPMCNVIVYTSVDCRLCTAAVDALESKGVRYCQKDINQSEQNMQTYDRLSGGKVCGPIAIIGDKVIKGFSYKFSEKSYSRAIDKLNSVL